MKIRGGSRLACALRSEAGPGSANEDAVMAVLPETADAWGLFAVADGLGGHGHGRPAAELALKILGAHRPVPGGPPLDPTKLSEDLKAALSEFQGSRFDRAHSGTTLSAILVGPDSVHSLHIGDSRIWRRRAGQWTLLSEDHNIAWRLHREGSLSADEVATSPLRSRLYRYLGRKMKSGELFDVAHHDLFPDDLYLLATDGVTHKFDTWSHFVDPSSSYNHQQLLEFLFHAPEEFEDDATALAVALH